MVSIFIKIHEFYGEQDGREKERIGLQVILYGHFFDVCLGK